MPDNESMVLLQLKDALVGHHGLVVQIERPIGTPLLTTIATQIPDQATHQSVDLPLAEWQLNHKNYRGVIATHPQTTMFMSDRIVVGVETTGHIQFLNEFRQQLLLIGGIGTISLCF